MSSENQEEIQSIFIRFHSNKAKSAFVSENSISDSEVSQQTPSSIVFRHVSHLPRFFEKNGWVYSFINL